MARRFARIVAFVSIPALMLVGCGDEGPTKQEFIARADRICADAKQDLAKLGRPKDIGDLERLSAEARRINARVLKELRALEAPEEDRAQIRRMIERLEHATETIPSLTEAARAGDEAALARAARRIRVATEDASRIARDYGFKECAEGSPTG